MSRWVELFLEDGSVKERIFIHSLKREQFDFCTPRFSEKPMLIHYLGIYDGNPDSDGDSEYEFILGNMAGTGAFTFPNPHLFFPYARISDTVENIETSGVSNRSAFNAGELILSSLYASGCFREEIASECDWLELGRHLRPYDGKFRADSTPAMDSGHIHINGLKSIMESHWSELLDPNLPEQFRKGVEYMNNQNPSTICKRYGIPMHIR